MSTTVDLYGIQTIRTGVQSTYILSLHSWGSGATFYKIGRTKNLPSRIGSLLAAFNDGDPKGLQGFPGELVNICAFDDGAYGGCAFGNDCEDRQYELVLLAHIAGDIEGKLHRRFDHLRLRSDSLHNAAGSAEWFLPSYEDDDNYPTSIDAWLDSRAAVSA